MKLKEKLHEMYYVKCPISHRTNAKENHFCIMMQMLCVILNLFIFSYLFLFMFHVFFRFNVAEIGAMSRDIPTEAKVLVRRMTNDPRVNVSNDWKLITILIGPNDFCLDFCYQRNPDKAPFNHERDLIATLRILRDNLPRTMVNLVLPPSELYNLNL